MRGLAISDMLLGAMNPHQRKKLDQLEDELGVTRGTLPIRGTREGYVFTEVHGVTVLITRKSVNPRGGYIVCPLSTRIEKRYTPPTSTRRFTRRKFLIIRALLNTTTGTSDKSSILIGSVGTTLFVAAVGSPTIEGWSEVLVAASFCQRHRKRPPSCHSWAVHCSMQVD